MSMNDNQFTISTNSKSIEYLIKEIELRKNKVKESDYKFFNCFIKSLFRKNISDIDKFINNLQSLSPVS